MSVGKGTNVDVHHDLIQGIPLSDNSVSLIFCEHLLGQFTRTQILFILRECKRVLDAQGKSVLRVSTPDLEFIAKTYTEGTDSQKEFLREIGLDKLT
ncbi:methyltransferase domain-containing protein, partial [Arthrospira platensis SPKY2]